MNRARKSASRPNSSRVDNCSGCSPQTAVRPIIHNHVPGNAQAPVGDLKFPLDGLPHAVNSSAFETAVNPLIPGVALCGTY